MTRLHRITGIVQGVGFRPYVWHLARELGLAGWVRNDAAGVEALVQGAPEQIDAFSRRLPREIPPLARVDEVSWREELQPVVWADFRILESGAGPAATMIGVDTAVCPDCLAEMFNPADRRWRYAFINCTHCGPRYTLTRRLPYDRAQTSMAVFPLCPVCDGEYRDPANRRFHAEPTACPECGPRLWGEGLGGIFPEVSPGIPPCPPLEKGGVKDMPPLKKVGDKTEPPFPKGGQGGFDGTPPPQTDPLPAILARLRAGQIVAIKGLGGFHLACDARNAAAVQTLRTRKNREEKPFALMAANVASLVAWVEMSAEDQALLESPERPIVLLRKRPGADAAFPDIAPGLAWLGAMLPYTPLHWLLFHEAAGSPAGTDWMAQVQDLVLVMTSANPGGEPLVIGNDEARERLVGIADAVLMHDRDIVVRCDDSVVRREVALLNPPQPPFGKGGSGPAGPQAAAAGIPPSPPLGKGGAETLAPTVAEGSLPLEKGGQEGFERVALISDAGIPPRPPLGKGGVKHQFIRRARGFTPRAIRLPRSGPSVLALGGYLKNTICVTRGDEAFLSQHIGGLDNPATCGMVMEVTEHLLHILRVEPQAVAHDLHPDFFSTRYALDRAAQWDVPAIAVQHHHAHLAAVAAEHGHAGPLLGLALDGVGLGDDAQAWGGELLRLDGTAFTRLGHLTPLALPGGDKAAREPWRMAASVLFLLGRVEDIPRRFPGQPQARQLHHLLERNLHCPPTTSLGRWFDAAAGLLGLREVMGYEGQAAMLLEGLAEQHGPAAAWAEGYRLHDGQLDLLPLLNRLADEPDAAHGAALFHTTLALALADWAEAAVRREHLTTVALGGGCFLNHILSRELERQLAARGITTLAARQAPPNDGGLSLGQAWVALQGLQPCV